MVGALHYLSQASSRLLDRIASKTSRPIRSETHNVPAENDVAWHTVSPETARENPMRTLEGVDALLHSYLPLLQVERLEWKPGRPSPAVCFGRLGFTFLERATEPAPTSIDTTSVRNTCVVPQYLAVLVRSFTNSVWGASTPVVSHWTNRPTTRMSPVGIFRCVHTDRVVYWYWKLLQQELRPAKSHGSN